MNPAIRRLLHRPKHEPKVMKLANLACGSVRPLSTDGVEWTHVDELLPVLGKHSLEWKQLLTEPSYREHDLTKSLPFENESFDGVMCSHFIEHVDCQQAVRLIMECKRVLKPGGILIVSVPDASYFRKVYDEDTVENAERLFGEPIHLPDGETTFFGYGLWNRYHKAVLSEDCLWAYFVRAGFHPNGVRKIEARRDMIPCIDPANGEAALRMAQYLNRLPFSLVMRGQKE